MSFIERERFRVGDAMKSAAPELKVKLEAVAQALAWATDPGQFASPLSVLMGRSEGSEDCLARLDPPASLCNYARTGL
jgi:hypothetical protein